MVPNGWQVLKLEELEGGDRPVVKAGPFGSSLKKDFYTETGYKIYGQEQVIAGDAFIGDYYINNERYLSLKSCAVEPGDILISLVGTIGKVLLIPDNAEPGIINPRLLRISLNNNQMSSVFFKYFLESQPTVNRLTSLAQGGTMGVLNAATLKALKIPVPPLPEQQEIAKILTTWDKAINTTERLIENSKQQKKALMQQLLTGQKRLLDDSGQRFSGDWEEVQLGDLGSTFNGLTGKTKVDFGSGEKYIPYMNIFKNTFVNTNHFDLVNLGNNEKQNKVQYGDIFFTTSSETPEEVGMSSVFIFNTQENIYLNSFCFGFRPKSLENISPLFIGYMLRSSKIRRKISILAQGSTRFNLSKTQLIKISIPLPSIKEQKKIAAVLTKADREIEVLEQQLSDLQQEKKALMQQLLTGKKRVLVA